MGFRLALILVLSLSLLVGCAPVPPSGQRDAVNDSPEPAATLSDRYGSALTSSRIATAAGDKVVMTVTLDRDEPDPREAFADILLAESLIPGHDWYRVDYQTDSARVSWAWGRKGSQAQIWRNAGLGKPSAYANNVTQEVLRQAAAGSGAVPEFAPTR